MTMDCGVLRERMPEVAAGRAEWTAAEVSHLAACGDCAAEWRLVSLAARLGADRGARVEPERLTRAVLAGVARRDQAARWKRVGWMTGLAAAAALALVVWRGRLAEIDVAAGPAVEGFHLPLAELETLDPAILEAVLERFDDAVGEGTTMDGPVLGDLDDTQLERVLRSLEG